MESDKNVEIIQNEKLAITKLMEEEEINVKTPLSAESYVAVHADDEQDNEKASGRRHQLLSDLLSQLESDSNNSSESKEKAAIVEEDPALSSEVVNGNNKSQNEEEIIKELKNIKKQNTITQCLLTAMIVITVAWQLSEVSIILKIKNGMSNPMKSVGGMLKGFFKRGQQVNVQDMMKNASEMQEQVMGPTSIPGIKIPEISQLGLPGFDTSDDED